MSNLHKNLCCGCSLESLRRGDSNEIPQHRFLWRNHKNLCCGCSLESLREGDSNEIPQHRFIWRNKQNYHLIIIKYAPYFFCCDAKGWKGWACLFCSHLHQQVSSFKCSVTKAYLSMLDYILSMLHYKGDVWIHLLHKTHFLITVRHNENHYSDQADKNVVNLWRPEPDGSEKTCDPE